MNKKLKRRIRECEVEIESIRALPYYSIFNQYAEQERDLQQAQLKLEKLKLRLASRLIEATAI